jgi:folate-binding protein YgfZ
MNSYRYSSGQFSQNFYAIKISGDDVQDFLQNQSTFDVSTLDEHCFHLTSFLDPQGRIECYGWLLKNSDHYLYLVPEKIRDEAFERLNRFLISEDVTIDEPILERWTVVVGAKAFQFVNASTYQGLMFADPALMSRTAQFTDVIPEKDLDLWQNLNGWPSFSGSDFKKEIINNTLLFDLSVSSNKGCYPGQETVSKIATRRGAAYAQVLLESKGEVGPGSILVFENKIGEALKAYVWDDQHYLTASVLRDFRVEGMKITASINSQEKHFIVRYFPLLSGKNTDKAEEVFIEATNYFKKDDNEKTEQYFKMAIDLDPHHADSIESLGVLLGRLGRFEEAIEWMKKLSEVKPSSVLAHTNMSVYLMKLGKIEEAEEHKSLAMVKSFQTFGEEAKIKEKLAEEKKHKAEEWAKRESMFKQVLEIDAEDTLANYGIGSIAVEKGEWAIAQSHLEKVISVDPKYSVAYLALGKAYQGLGKKVEAREIFSKGIKVAASKGDLMPANQMQFELDRL